MPLKLEKRGCTIGSSINTRTQKHGNENVTALDIPITGLALIEEELCEVMLDPKAHKKLYTKIRGRPVAPAWGKIVDSIALRGKVKGVAVVLYLGRKQLKMPDVTLSKVHIVPQEGGATWFNFTIQCVPDLDENHPIMETLFSKLGEPVDLALECESYGAQPDLPLEEEEGGEEEQEEDADDAGTAPAEDPEMSRTGRNIVDTAKRRGKRDKDSKKDED